MTTHYCLQAGKGENGAGVSKGLFLSVWRQHSWLATVGSFHWHVLQCILVYVYVYVYAPYIVRMLPLGMWNQKYKARLPQKDRATRYVSKFVLRFTSYGSYKGSKQQKWPSRSFKGTGNGAIQFATCDFLLVFHCNYVSVLLCIRDITFPNKI